LSFSEIQSEKKNLLSMIEKAESLGKEDESSEEKKLSI
jgi:hypothetical protein